MKKEGKYNRKWLRVVFLLYPMASVFCFIFPFIPAYFINKALSKLKSFRGHIGGIRITPFAIKIKVREFFLDKVNESTKERSLFISAEAIEVDVDWSKLWGGTLWGELKCTAPVFTLYKDSFSGAEVRNPMHGSNLGIDVYINKVRIDQGKVEFADGTAEPPVLMQITNIGVDASNISTRLVAETNFLTDVLVRADVYQGKLNASMKINLFSRTPDFIVDAGIGDVNMVLLNDFFRAYGKFDIHNGIMGMHTEIKSASGRFMGYVEPVITDLQIIGPEDHKDTIGKYLWKSLLGLAVEVFEDHSNAELAARIEFDEPFKNPEVHVGIAIMQVLGNAFVHGLTPYMRNEVKINL